MSAERHPETERKFRVHGLFRLPELAGGDAGGLPGVDDVRPAGTVDLLAVYYDTADLRLARSRVSLRRREGGSDEGWHLKLPTVDRETRQELRCPLGPEGSGPPEELHDLVLSLTRSAHLEPVATLRTERAVHELLDPEGEVLAELTDDSVSVLDGGHIAARFRELEVELRSGGPELLDTMEATLGAAGAVPGGYVSKVGRALGPLASAPPDVVEPAELSVESMAGEVVRAHLARNVLALLEQDRRVRLDEPDAVHQMRVAARRIRSGLKTFGPLVDEAWSTSLREEVAWVAGILGDVRDREVLRERLLFDLAEVQEAAPDIDTSATAQVIDRTLTDEAAAARAGVLEVLRSPRYLHLLDELVLAAQQPRLTDAADRAASQALPPLVGRAWRRLNKRAHALRKANDDVHWHEARIAAKQARYACEALVPVFGKPARRLAEQLEKVTELLGEHQDAAVAAATVRRLSAGRRVSGPMGFALGLLHGRERDGVLAARHRFRKIWPEVSDRRWRGWLEP